MLIILPRVFDENEVFRWLIIDAQLCIVIKCALQSSRKQFFCAYETCSEV